MMKKIGERIRRIRAVKDLTQSNVAEDLGMTTGAYAKIERGETDANVSRLLKIAEVLEVNVCDFFEDSLSIAAENQNPYGYASKAEVEELSKNIQILLKEIEKMKSEMQEQKPKKKKAAAKRT